MADEKEKNHQPQDWLRYCAGLVLILVLPYILWATLIVVPIAALCLIILTIPPEKRDQRKMVRWIVIVTAALVGFYVLCWIFTVMFDPMA